MDFIFKKAQEAKQLLLNSQNISPFSEAGAEIPATAENEGVLNWQYQMYT
jgi:hypothetical protein